MRESRYLEHKEDISNSFLKTVSAFANYQGGTIKFGIRDNGEVVGIHNPTQACLVIENKINDSLNPKVDFQLQVTEDTNVIILTVKEGLDKPYFYKSKAYKRNDSSTVEVESYELRRLILEGQNKTYESLPAEKQDITFHYLERSLMTQMSIKSLTDDILVTLGLYKKDEGFNRAAELLSDENTLFGIDVVRFGESINIILDRETYAGISILEQYERAMTMYRRYYQYEEIRGALREKVQKIPEEAYREAIANAIVHRAWDINAHIRVALYDERIEILSPGGLPDGMTKQEYLEGQISILRNPIIGNVFFRLHHIERFGTGVKRINSAYFESKVKPIFEVFENSIKVVLPVMQKELPVSDDEKLVYDSLVRNRKLSSSDVAKHTGFGKTKVIKLLKSMMDQGYIRIEGEGRGTKYTTT
ncbi:MAG TPA: putative DNA binding domain-containing protein [Sphaerochaeta sp.]|nr:putative DNA binding domain-containing protein [Sphaerochaeta sp.]